MARKTIVKDAGNGHTLAEYDGELKLTEALRRYADETCADSYVMVPSTWGPRMRVHGRVVRATYSPNGGKK